MAPIHSQIIIVQINTMSVILVKLDYVPKSALRKSGKIILQLKSTVAARDLNPVPVSHGSTIHT